MSDSDTLRITQRVRGIDADVGAFLSRVRIRNPATAAFVANHFHQISEAFATVSKEPFGAVDAPITADALSKGLAASRRSMAGFLEHDFSCPLDGYSEMGSRLRDVQSLYYKFTAEFQQSVAPNIATRALPR